MRKPLATFLRGGAHAVFPVWLKVTATLFLCILIPSDWKNYGPANFLWFSNISLIGSVLAL